MSLTSHLRYGIVNRDFVDYKGRTLTTSVSTVSTNIISLKTQIKQECNLDAFHISRLTIWKNDIVLEPHPDVEKAFSKTLKTIRNFRVEYGGNHPDILILGSGLPLSSIQWQTAQHVHFIVQIDRQIEVTGAVMDDDRGNRLSDDFVKNYSDIFIEVDSWKAWSESDLEANRIFTDDMTSPEFVQEFDKMLDRPRFSGDNNVKFTKFTPTDVQFESDLAVKDSVSAQELLHAVDVGYFKWESFWKHHTGQFLKEDVANTLFFDRLYHLIDSLPVECRIQMKLGETPWPFEIVLKGPNEGNGPYRKYKPKSDVLLSGWTLPRLVVEVQSNISTAPFPDDRIRMLLQAAAIVRKANKICKLYKDNNFVLPAIYMWKDGRAIRHSVYQLESEVQYKETPFDLNKPVERVRFIAQLYNLLDHMKNQVEIGKDIVHEIKKYKTELRKAGEVQNLVTNRLKRKRSQGDNDDIQGGRNRSTVSKNDVQTLSALREHGYEPQLPGRDDIDCEGEAFKPTVKLASNIFEVKLQADPDQRIFVAKRISKESDELTILKRLNDLKTRSNHIIALVDSFDSSVGSWAILPRLRPVMGYIFETPNTAYDICWQLIDGVAFLHERLIAHMDLKPDNLLIDEDCCLKIIDFDAAMQLDSEDAEVSDEYYGTDTWMAPEVENEHPSYSPIKADRWSCGEVISTFLDDWEGEGRSFVLRSVAARLRAIDPQERPSLLEWKKWKEESLAVPSENLALS